MPPIKLLLCCDHECLDPHTELNSYIGDTEVNPFNSRPMMYANCSALISLNIDMERYKSIWNLNILPEEEWLQ